MRIRGVGVGGAAWSGQPAGVAIRDRYAFANPILFPPDYAHGARVFESLPILSFPFSLYFASPLSRLIRGFYFSGLLHVIAGLRR